MRACGVPGSRAHEFHSFTAVTLTASTSRSAQLRVPCPAREQGQRARTAAVGPARRGTGRTLLCQGLVYLPLQRLELVDVGLQALVLRPAQLLTAGAPPPNVSSRLCGQHRATGAALEHDGAVQAAAAFLDVVRACIVQHRTQRAGGVGLAERLAQHPARGVLRQGRSQRSPAMQAGQLLCRCPGTWTNCFWSFRWKALRYLTCAGRRVSGPHASARRAHAQQRVPL